MKLLTRRRITLDQCPVKTTVDVIGGKWKPLILYYLKDGPIRFGELHRLLKNASQKVLTAQLRELEADEVIVRREYPGKPLKVEYTLGERGLTLAPILAQMADWGAEHVRRKATRAGSRVTTAQEPATDVEREGVESVTV